MVKTLADPVFDQNYLIMKHLTLVFIVFTCFKALGQLPNSGFEVWDTSGTIETPVGWKLIIPVAGYVLKDTLHVEGNYSVLIDGPVPWIEGPLPAIISSTGPSPSDYPQVFSFYCKCIVDMEGGKCRAGVQLFTATGLSNYFWESTVDIPVFQKINVNLFPQPSAPVDSILVNFVAESIQTPTFSYGGAKMNVDGIAIDGIGTATKEIEQDGFQVLPNPFQNELIVTDLDAALLERLTLRDMQGRTVLETRPTVTVLQTADLPPAVYWLTVTQKNGTLATRLVVKMP